MTPSTIAPQSEPDFTAPTWLFNLLVVAALSEFIGGLSTLPVLAGNLNDAPGPGPGGWVMLTYIVLRPFLAVAALMFLYKRHLRLALFCLAAIMALAWADMLPTVFEHGLQLEDGDAIMRAMMIFTLFVMPVLAIATAALAALRARPVLASLLGVSATVFGWIGVLIFTVSIAIHGF